MCHRPDGTIHGSPGKLVYVDRNVDARTGTIMAEGLATHRKAK